MKLTKKQKEWIHYPIGMFLIFVGAWIYIKFFPNMSSFKDLVIFYLVITGVYIISDKLVNKFWLKEG